MSAKYALLTGLLPAKAPVKARAPKKYNKGNSLRITQDCKVKPTLDPNKLAVMMGLRPILSESAGHRKSPNNMPKG
jgi:hypothetical protein